jgi:hypothetical protein
MYIEKGHKTNITLSADKELVKRAREYAAEHGTNLNHIIRQYLEQLTSFSDMQAKAEEFAKIARDYAGVCESGFVFNREEAHARGNGI